MEQKMSREFQLVLWGATGFTGRLVAKYIAENYADLKWAIGGRNRSSLESLRDNLTAIDSRLAKLEIIIADSKDESSLVEMTARTTVVCSTVGPYYRLGIALVWMRMLCHHLLSNLSFPFLC